MLLKRCSLPFPAAPAPVSLPPLHLQIRLQIREALNPQPELKTQADNLLKKHALSATDEMDSCDVQAVTKYLQIFVAFDLPAEHLK